MSRAIRWSDSDRYFGPFTYAKDGRGYHPLAVVLSSGDDEGRVCSLRMSAFGHTLIAALPTILKPHCEKVQARYWDADTIQRLGRDWYWQIDRRDYGFSVSEGFLQVFLGRQTHDSSTTKSWSKFLPWTQWRFVRRSMYDLNGEHFWTEPKRGSGLEGTRRDWAALQEAQDACPSQVFAFRDFDGEQLTAKTKIEEREWHFGEGWFRWLRFFRKPMIRRSLDIQFSGETGQRKGSWKGGTIGHSIDMEPGELHEAAFRRYCVAHAMTFVGAASHSGAETPHENTAKMSEAKDVNPNILNESQPKGGE